MDVLLPVDVLKDRQTLTEALNVIVPDNTHTAVVQITGSTEHGGTVTVTAAKRIGEHWTLVGGGWVERSGGAGVQGAVRVTW